MSVKIKLIIVMTVIVAVVAGGIVLIELQQVSGITRNLSSQSTAYIARQQAQYWNGYMGGYMRVLRTAAGLMGHFEELPAGERRNRYEEMLISIFEDQPDFIRMFTVWKPNALDGMDARNIGRIGSTGTGQFAFDLGRETGRISAYIPGSVVPAVMEHINGPNTRKDSVDHPVPVTVLGKEVYAVRIFVPIINKSNGETVGAVGCLLDIDFVRLGAEAAIMEYGEVSSLSVYSGNGFIMGSYNPERIGKMLIDSETQFGEYISIANDAVNHGREFWCSGYDQLLSTTLQIVMVPVAIGNSDTTWSVMVGTAEWYVLRDVTAMTRFAITLLIMALIIAVVIINIVLSAILT
ncbi:MAG: hypothetical protein LBB89_01020 [Treponema sp.]|jgi:methyl-accepting chemotaxis protein|nr:hypothetical protein [Treponema sp.]